MKKTDIEDILRIVRNPNEKEYNEITQKVKDNDGYCPCMLIKNDDTKCICRAFREQREIGFCHCGRYKKDIATFTIE